jgi:hypothetical protein
MESKRQRKEVDYYEHESILPHNAHKTSDWTSKITNTMHIRVQNHDIFQLPMTYEPKNIHLDCITDDMWKGYIDIEKLPIDAKYKTLVDEIKTVYDENNSISEYYIDTYVLTLFMLMNLNDYPLSINPQHVLGVDISEMEEHIVSIPDFIIKSKKSKMVIVVEDKNMASAKFINQWKENQVMGEIFVAAHNMRISQSSELYAIRIIGTFFTFYKAFITPEYIKESALGLPVEHFMDVYRYPDPGSNYSQINALDFCKIEERRIIIEYLSKISKELVN